MRLFPSLLKEKAQAQAQAQDSYQLVYKFY